jgi:hypothetical protein
LFLFALPAGALADMLDKRRLILALEILTTLFSLLFVPQHPPVHHGA